MPYLMTDDGFCDHEKVDGLTDGAFRLHVAGMHYCARKLTDGLVPSRRVSRLVPTWRPRDLAELLEAGVWHTGGHGCGTDACPVGEAGSYVVHDYLQWNKPRKWWEAKRATDAARIARFRAKRRRDEEGENGAQSREV